MKKIKIVILLLIFILICVCAFDAMFAVERVTVTEADLSFYAQKENLTDEDYTFLLRQTGLGKPAVDALRQQHDCLPQLECFQKQMASNFGYKRSFLFFPTTTAEVLKDEHGEEYFMELPELEPGDIFITKSTKTLLYRHGHAAILLDDGRTLAEAMMLGLDSSATSAKSWASYATLMILRPKVSTEIKEKAVAFTKENLLRVPYNLFAAKNNADLVKNTHCSHLVWKAYRQTGLDLDSDGGFLVTPCDIARFDEFELVFCYGFGEDMKW